MPQAVPYWRLSAFYFAYFAYVGAMSPYFSLYLQQLGLGAFAISVLMALQQLMRVLAPNFWGRLADRDGNTLGLLRISLLLMVASFCGLFAAKQFGPLFAVLAVMSFFGSAIMPLHEAMTFGWLRGNTDRYGAVRMWGSVGFIVTVVAAGMLLDRVSIDWLLWIVLPTLGCLLACSFALPKPHVEVRREAGGPVWPVLRRPEVAALFLSCFLMAVAHGPLYTFYSIYLAENGYGKSAIGALWSIGVVAEILVFLLMPRMVRRWTYAAILVASFAAAALRFGLIGFAVESIVLMVLAQLLHAASFGSHHAASLGLIDAWFTEGQRVRGQALYLSLSFGAGGMLGSLGSGLLWERAGPAVTFGLAACCALAGGVLVVWQGRNFPHRALSTTVQASR